MLKKIEVGTLISTIVFALVAGTTLQSMPALALNSNTTSNLTTTEGIAGATYGGVDIDSSTSTINCEGEAKGPVKTERIQADAFIRQGAFAGNWNIVREDKNGQDKGGIITGGWTDGSKYQINGREVYDGICKAEVPGEITISSDCGTGVEIKYGTVEGQTDNFNGNGRCYSS
jgi:hypothetical protein